jgi:hypothetical protein
MTHVARVHIVSLCIALAFSPIVFVRPADAASERITLNRESRVAVLQGYPGNLEGRPTVPQPSSYRRALLELFVTFLRTQYGAYAARIGPGQMEDLLREYEISPKESNAVARALRLARYTHAIAINRESTSAAGMLVTLEPSVILADGKIELAAPIPLQILDDNGGNLPGKLPTPITSQLLRAFDGTENTEVRKTVEIGCITVDNNQKNPTNPSWHIAVNLTRELRMLYDEPRGFAARSGVLLKLGYTLLATQDGEAPGADCKLGGPRTGAADAEYTISGTVYVNPDSAINMYNVIGEFLVKGPDKETPLRPWDTVEPFYGTATLQRLEKFGATIVADSKFVDRYIEEWRQKVAH